MNKITLLLIILCLRSFSQNPSLNWDKISLDIFNSLAYSDTNLILKYTADMKVAERSREIICDTNIERKKYINSQLEAMVNRDKDLHIYYALNFNSDTKKKSGVDLRKIKKIDYNIKYKKVNEYIDCHNNGYTLKILLKYLNTPYKITVELREVDDQVFITKHIIWD